jgi:electron transport complex protein RnfD
MQKQAIFQRLDQRLWQWRTALGAKWCVVLLLLPPALFGVGYFGLGALAVLLTSVISCYTLGILFRVVNGLAFRWDHPGSVLTGLLIGLTCGPATPLYMVITGAVVAEFLGKVVLSRRQGNYLNPAVLGRSAIALWETWNPIPYADLSTGASTLFKSAGGLLRPEYVDALLGTCKGAIGETSALILIVVGALMLRYVVVKRHAALAMLVAVPLAVLALPPSTEIVGHAPWVANPVLFLIGGPTLLLAFFFMTDPATTPQTIAGAVIFGIGVALMAVYGKLYTNIAGVEMYGILVMNLLTPYLNRFSFQLPSLRPRCD